MYVQEYSHVELAEKKGADYASTLLEGELKKTVHQPVLLSG